MKSTPFKDEAELQALLWAAIQNETLSDSVVDRANMRELLETEHQENAFPQFSIDRLVRRRCLESGAQVLASLDLLIPMTDDKNVSITAGEIMRPDIVCINPEKECVVIFELKNATQTGRQAVTELLAYEHEIKNLLPFLSNYDVHFVLISPEWSTLMDHAVASAITWSGRKILCLNANLEEGQLRLDARIPPAWTITGSMYVPGNALPSVTICLYEKDAHSPENVHKEEIEKTEELDPRIWTAMEVIAREGDRTGGHGFALLWRDYSNISLTSYNITVVGVAPFPFYKEARLRQTIGDETNDLVGKLDQYLVEHDPSGHSASLLATAKSAFPLLKEVAHPTFEGFSTWGNDQTALRQRAEPLLTEFWGELGVHAREYVIHPAVREHRRNTLVNGTGDWRHPSVGLPLIASFTRPEIFPDGNVRCSDAFRLGVLLGLDRFARLNIQNGVELASLKCLFVWNRIFLMAAIDEVRLLADAAENVSAPADPFKFFADPLVDDREDHERFINWLAEEFLQKDPAYIRMFEIGFNGAIVFDNESKGFVREQPHEKYVEPVAEPIRQTTRELLELYQELVSSGSARPNARDAFNALIQTLGQGARFESLNLDQIPMATLLHSWGHAVNAADSVIPAVFHRHSPLSQFTVDWAWLRQGVTEMREKGILDAGIILLPNGTLVSGRTMPDFATPLMKASDPDRQVLFLDQSNGFGSLRVVAWEDLENGTAFDIVRHDDLTDKV
jgi:hypothetical protein